ncbi:unnamed protein product [Amoebophrya sp. A25]|nr:unnamed protein product [Amoebophrya sp. A25]|eukprot:GSA25T00020142001.1
MAIFRNSFYKGRNCPRYDEETCQSKSGTENDWEGSCRDLCICHENQNSTFKRKTKKIKQQGTNI